MTVYAHLSPFEIQIYSNLTVSYEQVTSRSFTQKNSFVNLPLKETPVLLHFKKLVQRK
jgi:hypothetical protein